MLRKMLALTFAGLLTISMVGCGEPAATETEVEATTPAAEAGEEGSGSTEMTSEEEG